MWECGLKQRSDVIRECPNGVTPYVGVWIETQQGRLTLAT